MELIIIQAVFPVYWFFAGCMFVKNAFHDFMVNKKMTFSVLTGAFWGIGHFTMLCIMTTDLYNLLGAITTLKICVGIYMTMLALLFINVVILTVKRFKEGQIVSGIAMIIISTLTFFMPFVPLVMYHMFF